MFLLTIYLCVMQCILREDRAAVGTGGVVGCYRGCYRAIVGCCLGVGGRSMVGFFLLENELDI